MVVAWFAAVALGADWVVVPTFETDRPRDPLRHGLADLVAQELLGAGVPVLPGPTWERLEQGECATRRACPAARWVLLGEVIEADGEWVLVSGRIVSAEETTIVASAYRHGTRAGLLDLQALVAQDLATALGSPGVVLGPATRSLRAVKAVGRALRAIDLDRRGAARSAIRRALRADPAYVRAQQLRARIDSAQPFTRLATLGP